MKKIISILAITVFMITAMSVTALARCHGGGYGGGYGARQWRQPQPQYQPLHSLCTVAGCEVLGPHQHDEIWYCSQTCVQGDYLPCTVEGCALLGYHEHDGSYYHCVYYGAGYGCGRW